MIITHNMRLYNYRVQDLLNDFPSTWLVVDVLVHFNCEIFKDALHLLLSSICWKDSSIKCLGIFVYIFYLGSRTFRAIFTFDFESKIQLDCH